MKKTLSLTLLLLAILFGCTAPGKLSAQNINRDSLFHESLVRDSISRDSVIRDSITNIGTVDGKKIKLSPKQKEQFKAAKSNYNSDLFKPVSALASNPALLKDSVYVQAFRMAAYKKILGRTPGHYILIGGAVCFTIYTIVSFLHSITADAYASAIGSVASQGH